MRSEAAPRLHSGRPLILAAGAAALAFSTARLWPARTDMPVFEAAGGVAFALLILATWLQRRQFPTWALLLVPIGCDLFIALLRQAQGGSNSGYSPLVLVPVVWTGLVLGRRGVYAISACTALLFALPILVEGAPLYPSNGWRGVVLWSLVSLFVGLGADRVMRTQEEHTELSTARARELDRLAEAQNAIATSEFDLDAVLAAVVQEASRLTGADAAVVEIPDGDELVYRAASGTAEAFVGLRLPSATAISGLALRTGETLVCDDSETDERVDLETCRRVGARSLVVVPLRHDAQTSGVLKAYRASPNAFRPEHVRILTLLADMIGSALARAELLEKLHRLALTDELTGLANRRSWNDHLEHALARARRSGAPLSLVVLDLNGFKQVNDEQGHAAGDRLLRTVSACWSSVLRDSDILGRIGGDEFAVILDQADASVAARIAERLAASLPAGAVTAASGTATWNRREDAEGLLSRADSAMYEQKEEREGARYAVLSPTGQATPVPPSPQ
ncbi:MAG TPA: sensor domain-containing diguanylate cyclase [Gaiellaceae bacterium]|nr:sensor domain-containing diguanylate cyclase [Gaiellaceae bacterium]